MVKTHGGKYGKRGIPDLLICYKGIFVGLEVKRPGQKPTKLQREHLAAIEAAGGYSEVVCSAKEALIVIEEVKNFVALLNEEEGIGKAMCLRTPS